jgi:hypothetical protein
MADCTSVCITIGGKLKPGADLSILADAILDDDIGPDWDAKFADEEEVSEYIAAALADGEALILLSNEHVGAYCEATEAACQELGLTYCRADDGHYTWTPCVAYWTPELGAAREWTGSVDDHTPHLSAIQLRAVLRAGLLDRELELMEASKAIPPLAIEENPK